MRSTQYGTAAKMPTSMGLPSASFRPSSVSLIAFGWPGKLMISVCLRITAVWRDRIAVGTKRSDIWRMRSPNPSITRSAIASVASGVTSRGAGPVPPVVSTSAQPSSSTNCFRVASINGCSSGITRETKVSGFLTAPRSQFSSAGNPSS